MARWNVRWSHVRPRRQFLQTASSGAVAAFLWACGRGKDRGDPAHQTGAQGRTPSEISLGYFRHGEVTLLLDVEGRAAADLVSRDEAGMWGELDAGVRRDLHGWLSSNGVALYEGRDDRAAYNGDLEAPFRSANGRARVIYPVEVTDRGVRALYTVNLAQWVPNPFKDDRSQLESILSVPPAIEQVNAAVQSGPRLFSGTDWRVKVATPNWMAAAGNC